jgi:hypothetical protein
VLLRFMTLAIAQAFDFATFSVMVRSHGLAAEANPVVQGLFATLGTPAVVLAKIALVTLITALAVAAAVQGGKGRWAIVGGVPVALGITAGLIGGITNAAVILPG